VGEIRRALDDDKDNPAFIQTVPREGYRFVAQVAVELPEGALRSDLLVVGGSTRRQLDSSPPGSAAPFPIWRRLCDRPDRKHVRRLLLAKPSAGPGMVAAPVDRTDPWLAPFADFLPRQRPNRVCQYHSRNRSDLCPRPQASDFHSTDVGSRSGGVSALVPEG
jgi:hypothetical protein